MHVRGFVYCSIRNAQEKASVGYLRALVKSVKNTAKKENKEYKDDL
jgi:hypothetical protein